jgi:hypothetical protein
MLVEHRQSSLRMVSEGEAQGAGSFLVRLSKKGGVERHYYDRVERREIEWS